MADEKTGAAGDADEEPTRVTAAGNPARRTEGATGAEEWPAPPQVENVAPPLVANDSGITGATAASTDAPFARPTDGATGEVPPVGATAQDPDSGSDADATRGSSRARTAADRTAEGAKVAADRVSQAASATAQALRETDVREIARNTTSLIENTRPFFLAAFAIVFTFLAAVENHAAIGVVFAVGALLCVLGAAFSASVDHLLKRRDGDDR